jgi:predicted phosphodiesterase
MNLIVPDIHERLDALQKIQPLLDEASQVIFLGDWFDSFDMKSDTLGTIQYLKEALQNPKYKFCIGNHDCHYFFDHGGFMCSGFRRKTSQLVSDNLTNDELKQFKLCHIIGTTVMSHAGYHPEYLGDPKDGGTYTLPSAEEAEQAMDMAFAGKFHRLFNPGAPVGGIGTGGPTWLRPQEWEPVGFPQVVGHTPQRRPIFDESVNAIFLDTGLHHVLWLDDAGNPTEFVEI